VLVRCRVVMYRGGGEGTVEDEAILYIVVVIMHQGSVGCLMALATCIGKYNNIINNAMNALINECR
jgi:hypothetical protein